MKRPTTQRLVSVFKTSNSVMASLALSYLEEAGIPAFAKNMGTQDLVGVGTMGTGFNPLTGPIEVMVNEDCARRADRVLRALLRDEVYFMGQTEFEEYKQVSFLRQLRNEFISMVIVTMIAGEAGYYGDITIGIALFLFGMLTVAFGFGFCRRMHSLGYDWADVFDANYILIKCRRRALRLPPAAEVATIPGIRNSSEAVIKFLDSLRDYKREARRNIK